MTLDEAKERVKNLTEVLHPLDQEALKVVLKRLEQLEAMQRFAEVNSQNLYD